MGQSMRYLQRGWALLRSRGPFGFLRFVLGRLVYRSWRSRVYRDQPDQTRLPSQWPQGYRYEICHRPSELSEAGREALERVGGREFFMGLDPSDRLYFVWHGAELASFGGIFWRSPQLQVLGLPDSAILVGGCQTTPSHQRRGLYRLALNETAIRLRAEGLEPVYIEAHPNNTASLTGITSAGFSEVGLVEAGIWFNCFVQRGGKWSRMRKERRA